MLHFTKHEKQFISCKPIFSLFSNDFDECITTILRSVISESDKTVFRYFFINFFIFYPGNTFVSVSVFFMFVCTA